MRNHKLMRDVVGRIKAFPEQWRQTAYHCGTQHCVAGWTQILGGRLQDVTDVTEDGIEVDEGHREQAEEDAFGAARDLLGLSNREAFYLFGVHRTLPQIEAFADLYCDGRELLRAEHVYDMGAVPE